MDSSDDETLFNSIPICDTSKRPNVDLMKNGERTKKDTVEEKHWNIFSIRDVSVKLARVPNKQDSILSKSKRKSKFSSIHERKPKKRPKMEEFEEPQKLQIVKKLEDMTENTSKSPRDNLDKQSMKIKNNLSLNIQENTQPNKTTTSRTFIYQGTSSDSLQRKKREVLCNKTYAKEPSDVLSSLVLHNENTKQNSYGNKANTSDERISSQITTILAKKKDKVEYNSRNQFTGRIISSKSQYKQKYFTSGLPDGRITIKKRKKYRRIISADESSSDEDITANNTKDNIKNDYRLFHEVIDQEKSQFIDVPVVRDLYVKLIRLEEMNNIYFRNWQERNVPQMITTRHQLSCPNKISSLNNKEEPNVKKKFKTTSNLQMSKYHAVNTLNMTKLTTKYKLFKIFEVLMIKLEDLGYSSKNGTYSATEIDHLTKKYIKRMKHNSKYRLTYLPKEKTAIAGTKENSGKPENLFHKSSDNIVSSETLIVEENSVEDNHTVRNVKSGNNPSKTYGKFTSVIFHKTLIPELPSSSIDKGDSQMKLLEIWPKSLTENPQEILTETCTSIQSPSIAYLPPFLPSEAKVESKNINNQLALSCPSSKRDNMPTLSKEFTSLQITSSELLDTSTAETSLKSIATCDEILIPQLLSNTISPNNLNIEEVVCKNDLSQSKENLVTKNAHASKTKNTTTILNSPVLNMLSKNTLLKLASKASKVSTEHTTNKKLRTVIFTKKAKGKMYNNQHPLLKKTKGLYKCRICTRSFLDYQLFHKHLVNDLCGANNIDHLVSNASKSLESSKLEQTIIDEKCNLERPKLSISQQSSSIDKDSDVRISIQSCINYDGKISYSSPLVSDTKSKSKKPKSVNLNLENKTQNHKAKHHKQKILQKKAENAQQTICNICSRIFDSRLQLSEHIFKHTKSDLQNAYMSIKNQTLPVCPPKINDTNDQMPNCTNKNQINVEETITMPKDLTKEQKLENIISSNILENGLDTTQHDTSKNKSLSKLQQIKDIINKNWDELFLISNTNNGTNETQSMGKTMENNIEKCSETFSESQQVKSITICECHKNEVIEDVGIQIEIILFCNICQMLFRRVECFETHYRFSQGACCERNRREDRIPQFFCSCCLKMLSSPKDMLRHLEWHAEFNRNNTITFRCNICRVIFYGLDLLFKAHFYNHARNPFFVASRFSFSKSFYIGSKLIKVPIGKPREVFIQIADYVCQSCKMPFLSEKNMKFHEKHCYDNVKNVDSPNVNNVIPLNFKNIPVLLVCGFCNTYFSNLTAFELHTFMHKQKRNVEAHYTCVTLSDMKKVYICNVCGISCQTIKSFKEHWSTHGALKEDYICSKCNKHFASIHFFFEHLGIHKENGNIDNSIKCKVIYHDTEYINGSYKSDYEYNTKRHIIGIDIPYMTLTYFEKKESADSTITVKSSTSITIDKDLSKIDEILAASSIDDEVQIIDTSKDTNNSQIARLSSDNVILTKSKQPVKGNNAIENEPKINDNKTRTNSTDNLDDLNDKLMILENEKNFNSNRTTKQTNNVLSHIQIHDIFNVQIANKEAPFKNVTPIVTIDEFYDISRNLSTNIKDNVTTKESMTSSTSDNVSTSNTMTKTDNESIKDLMIAQDDNRIEIQPLTSTTNSSISPKDLSSDDTAKFAPKSFLRVKSLTELMSPSKKDSGLCNSPFDSSQKLGKDLQLCNRSFIGNRNTAFVPLTSYASETLQLEPEFRLPMHSSTMTSSPIDLSNHALRPVSHNTENDLDKVIRPPPPPYNASHINSLHMAKYNLTINNTVNNRANTQSKVTCVPHYAPCMGNIQLRPKPIYYQNPQTHIIYQPTSKLTQFNQQYYSNVQPHMQTNYQSSTAPQLIAQQHINSNNLLHNNNTILPAQNSTLIPSVNQNNMHAGNTTPIIHTVPPSAPEIPENFICRFCPNFVYKSMEEFILHFMTNHKI